MYSAEERAKRHAMEMEMIKKERLLEKARNAKIKRVEFVIEGNITTARIRAEELLLLHYVNSLLFNSGIYDNEEYINQMLKSAYYDGETSKLYYEFGSIEQQKSDQEA